MFIEKLKKADVKKMFKELDAKNRYNVLDANFYDIGAFSKWFVQLERVEDKKQLSLSFGDFGINTSILLGLNPNDFKMAMYHIFGDEYKHAFNENLRKKYESEMIK